MHLTFSRISAAAFSVVAVNALAAQTGSIAGTVTDKDSRQPIEQAMVSVQGTSYGIYTKANGTYTILGVPPGTYIVTAKRVGYQAVDAQNVTVRIDVTRTQDFELTAAPRGELVPLAPSTPRVAPSYLAAAAAQLGPGSVFGIDAYECASCGMARYRDSTHVVYTFGAEPVVTSVSPQSRERIRPGDVIVAVNGNPITTRAGADMFAYPDSGEVKLTLRRNGTNIDITAYSLNVNRVTPARGGDFAVAQGGVGGRGGVAAGAIGGAASAGRGGRGGAGGFARSPTPPDSGLRERLTTAQCVTTAPAAARGDSATLRLRACPRDSARVVAQGGTLGGTLGGRAGAMAPTEMAIASTVELRNYGFTLSCRPDCTRMRSRTGALYWKFEGYPTVAIQSLVKGGLAEKAGIREGDVLISVNGQSPLSEEGAVLLNRSDRELELTVEISRGGKREKYSLKL